MITIMPICIIFMQIADDLVGEDVTIDVARRAVGLHRSRQLCLSSSANWRCAKD